MIIALVRAEKTFIKIDDTVHRVQCWGATDKPCGNPPANVVPLVYNDGRLVDANDLGDIEPFEEPGEDQ